jgi:HK97 family phage prohead protease
MLRFKGNYFDDMDDEKGIIKGYASMFNNKDSDGDIITKGAYSKTLQENSERIAFLYQHNMNQPIGKPLSMKEDEKGLFIEAKISDSSLGQDVKTMVSEGILKEFSVGFIPIKEDLQKDVNYIKEIKLFEFSLVTLAANPLAKVTEYKGTKSVDNLMDEFDKLIKMSRKLDNPHLLEFELRMLKEKSSLILNESQKSELEKESVESKKIANELDNFLLRL